MEIGAGIAVLGAWIFASMSYFGIVTYDKGREVMNEAETSAQAKLFAWVFIPSALIAVGGTIALLAKI